MSLVVALDATPLLGELTGVGELCLGALRWLPRNDELDVRAFAVTWRRRGELPSRLPPGVASIRAPMPARPLQAAWRRVPWPPLEWFTGRLDVVHGTNFVVPPTRRAARVVTVHDLTSLRFPELCHPSTLAFPGMIRRAVREGAFVHTPSRFVADEVCEALGAPPERVRCVSPGVPTDPEDLLAKGVADAAASIDAGAPAMRGARTGGTGSGALGSGRGLLPDWVRRYVLALGTVEPRKDLPTLVRAFAELEDDRGLALVVAGPDGWGSDALLDAVRKTRLSERVVRLGWVSPGDRAELLHGAAVFAYPSLYEGFGFPPLEAMAVGVPVVTTDAGALPEIAGGGSTVVGVGDSSGMASALAELLDDDEAADRAVARGLAWVGRFGWEGFASGLAQLYIDAARRD